MRNMNCSGRLAKLTYRSRLSACATQASVRSAEHLRSRDVISWFELHHLWDLRGIVSIGTCRMVYRRTYWCRPPVYSFMYWPGRRKDPTPCTPHPHATRPTLTVVAWLFRVARAARRSGTTHTAGPTYRFSAGRLLGAQPSASASTWPLRAAWWTAPSSSDPILFRHSILPHTPWLYLCYGLCPGGSCRRLPPHLPLHAWARTCGDSRTYTAFLAVPFTLKGGTHYAPFAPACLNAYTTPLCHATL